MGEKQDVFSEALADEMKASAGALYQPSTGGEGMIFMERWCECCTRDALDPDTGDGGCPIIAATLIFKPSDPGYPEAWTISKSGQPDCSEFEAKPLTNAGPTGGGL